MLLCVIGVYVLNKFTKQRQKSVGTPRGRGHQRQASESFGDADVDDGGEDDGDNIIVELSRVRSLELPKEGVMMQHNASSLMYVKDGHSLTDLLAGDTADGNTLCGNTKADGDEEVESDSPRVDTTPATVSSASSGDV